MQAFYELLIEQNANLNLDISFTISELERAFSLSSR